MVVNIDVLGARLSSSLNCQESEQKDLVLCGHGYEITMETADEI